MNKILHSFVACIAASVVVIYCFTGSANAASSNLPASVSAADGSVVTGAERQAILSLVSFFEACNAKDGDKVRKINWTLQNRSEEELANGLFAARNYVLHDVEIIASTSDTISASMLYSCEMQLPNTIGKTINHSRTFVDFSYVSSNEWKITGAKSNPGLSIIEQLQAERKAALKYGTSDLSKWSSIPGRRSDFLKWYNTSRDIQRQLTKGWDGKALDRELASHAASLQALLDAYPAGDDGNYAKDALFAVTTYKNSINMALSSILFLNSMSVNKEAKNAELNAMLADGVAGKRLQDSIKATAPAYYKYLDKRIQTEDTNKSQSSDGGSWKISVAQKILLQFFDESLTKLNGTF